MGLYDRSFRRLDIDMDKLSRLNKSLFTNSFVYRYKDLIVKRYWHFKEFAIGSEEFDVLSKVDSKHFMKLYDLYTIITDEELEDKLDSFYRGEPFFISDGYTAKYYEPDSTNPILLESSYLIDNIEGLMELVDTLSNRHISMRDVNTENTVINRDGMIIIDPDFYKLSDSDVSELKNENYRELYFLIERMFEVYAKGKKKEAAEYFTPLRKIDSKESLIEVQRCLKKVRRPIYLLDKD